MKNLTIGQNINYYRRQKGFSQKELAEIVGISPQNMLRLEKDSANPTVSTLKKILDALQITPNQLFGTTQYENIHIQLPFAQNFQNLRKKHNLSISEMSKILNISENDISELETGTLIPSEKLINKICKEFMISEDDLMENALYKRTKNEIELLNTIKYRNQTISNILNTNQYAEPLINSFIDPETGALCQKEVSSYELAKNDILAILEECTLNELLEAYKAIINIKISKLSDTLLP